MSDKDTEDKITELKQRVKILEDCIFNLQRNIIEYGNMLLITHNKLIDYTVGKDKLS